MYQINLDTQERPLDGRHIDRLIDHWLAAVAADVTPTTLAGYRQKIDHFRRWWAAHAAANDHQITKTNLAAFGAWLAQQPSRNPPPTYPSAVTPPESSPDRRRRLLGLARLFPPAPTRKDRLPSRPARRRSLAPP